MICGEKLKINLLLKQLFMRLKSAFLSRAMLLLIFLVVFSNTIFATKYYVSSSLGKDTNSGLSESSPWKTLTKVNSTKFYPGDEIRFKRGDTWVGSLTASSSGTGKKSAIIYAWYGSGYMPKITGFQTITGWKSLGNGVYSAPTTASNSLNMVTVNGVSTPRGRYPNNSYLSFETHSGKLSVTDLQLTSTPNWTGADIVVRSARWRLEKKTITSHLGNTLTFLSLSSTPTDGYGYFITNDLKTLDQVGEWYCKNGIFYMYFGSNSPSNYVVNVSTVETLFSSYRKAYITVDGISFQGANNRAIYISGSGNIGNVIRYCDILNCGKSGVETPGDISNLTIENCNISGINNIGISVWSPGAIIRNNNISNIGVIEGMGVIDGYNGLICTSDNSLIEYNSIKNIGYNGIRIKGNNVTVKNNYIESFCRVVDDGSGIYAAGQQYSGRVITGNIILNGVGRLEGTNSTDFYVNGIYLDEPVTGIIVSNNTVANCSRYGVCLHESWGINVNNNTLFNNSKAQICLAHDSNYPAQTNINMTGNIFFSKLATQFCLYFISTLNDIHFGSASNNVYARPLDDALTFYTKTASTAYMKRDLTSWRAFTGYDLNSTKSPVSITNANNITLEYNATKTVRTITLPYPVIDARGVKYSGSLSLQPYTSLVLMKDPNPTASTLKSASLIDGNLEDASDEIMNVDIYPNPSSGNFTVRFSGLPNNESYIDIIDITGKKIASRQVSSTLEVFDLNNQRSGVYLVRAIQGKHETIQKLIINK